jgi:hypothetical protein
VIDGAAVKAEAGVEIELLPFGESPRTAAIE